VLNLSAPGVPVEFVGLARVFRSQVKLVDVKLRREMIAGAEQLYRTTIPQEFRIGAVEAAKNRTEFAISEMRIAISRLRHDKWDEDHEEPGLSLCRFTVVVMDGKLHLRWLPLANISLHALARRIERGHEHDHATLVRGLAVLTDAGEEGERVNTPGGFWLGGTVDADGTGHAVRLRNVRTWLAN
jgi:hypothetical protein